MTGIDPFLAAIRERTDDDGPRLVFADWLDENGDPTWAEILRIGCELNRPGPDNPGRQNLRALWEELAERHRESVRPRLPARWGLMWWGSIDLFGFHTAVSLERSFDVTEDPAVWDRHLVDTVWVRERGVLERLARSPIFRRVRDLRGCHGSLDRRSVQALLHSGFAENLRSLDLSVSSTKDATAAAVLGSPNLAGLRRLELGRRVGDEALFACAWRDGGPRLRELSLHWGEITDRGIMAIVADGRFSELRVLRVRSYGVGNPGAIALASAGHLCRLEELDFGSTRLGDAGVAALADAEHLRGLKRLRVPRGTSTQARRRLISALPDARIEIG